MKDNQFERWHPLTQIIYFITVMVIMIIRPDPIIIAITVLAQIILGILMSKCEFFKLLLCIYLPAAVMAIIINPLFSHEGVTILTYFPDGNPLTLESIVYGIISGMLVCGICILFFSFGKVMTADRLMYLSGRLLPAIALIISMTLRYIPEFKRHMKQVNTAYRCIRPEEGRLKRGFAVMESMIMWSFEKSIERSDSMRARGYGIGRRSSYARYIISRRDIVYSLFIISVAVLTIVCILTDTIYVQIYPYIYMDNHSGPAVIVYVLYTLVTVLPAADIIMEDIRWKSLQSKI